MYEVPGMQRLNNSEEGTHFRSFVYCAGAGVGRFWGGEVVKGDMEAPAGPTTEAATLKYGGQKNNFKQPSCAKHIRTKPHSADKQQIEHVRLQVWPVFD